MVVSQFSFALIFDSPNYNVSSHLDLINRESRMNNADDSICIKNTLEAPISLHLDDMQTLKICRSLLIPFFLFLMAFKLFRFFQSTEYQMYEKNFWKNNYSPNRKMKNV